MVLPESVTPVVPPNGTDGSRSSLLCPPRGVYSNPKKSFPNGRLSGAGTFFPSSKVSAVTCFCLLGNN